MAKKIETLIEFKFRMDVEGIKRQIPYLEKLSNLPTHDLDCEKKWIDVYTHSYIVTEGGQLGPTRYRYIQIGNKKVKEIDL